MSGLVFGLLLVAVIIASVYLKFKDIKVKEKLITENQLLKVKIYH